MKLLLDTNVLLWTLAGSQRIRSIQDKILSDSTVVHVSTVSWWEIVIKSSIGKLDADVTLLREAALNSGLIELPVLGEHAESMATLPFHHRDPFDRMLVAQAITEPMHLVTSDAKLSEYSSLVWLI
jgi:PIN domain nuclease of toxin-antitoxin system